MTAKALVIDDEVDLCRLMQMTLTKMGINCDLAYDLKTAYEHLESNSYDFCLTDLRLPDGSGLDIVRHIAKAGLSTPVAVITAHGNMDLAIEALKFGAFDFVNKPLELPRLRQLIEHALRVSQQIEEDHPIASQKSAVDIALDTQLVGESDAIKKLKATIVKLARSQAPVFLWGESGTGKEVVAKLIHELSPRQDGSFVPVNCGAIPAELMESEFFGHKKGSFTGATTDKIGLFQQADGGTLFLDEVADMPLAMQVKLLRAIQEKTIRAIGDTKEVPVDIRLLSATHKNLHELVQQGLFRQDLFYRINVIELKLPTLNEREDDIKLLANYFLEKITQEWQIEEALSLSDSAIDALRQHQYAGNVRELRNLLERAVTLAESPVIDAHHLGLTDNNSALETNNAATNEPTQPLSATLNSASKPQYEAASNQNNKQTPKNSAPNSAYSSVTFAHNITQFKTNISPSFSSTLSSNYQVGDDSSTNTSDADEHTTQQPSIQSTHTRQSTHTSGTSAKIDNNGKNDVIANNPINDQQTAMMAETKKDATSLPDEGLEAYLQAQEKQMIMMALDQTQWNKTKAAQLLGTSFRSLRYRMKKLGIDNDNDNDNDNED